MNISELYKKYKKSNEKQYMGLVSIIDNLTEEELKDVKEEILSWSDENFSNTKSIFKNYLDIEIDKEILRVIFVKNINLAVEEYTGGIGDTCVRDQLFDAFVKELGVRDHWPLYSENVNIKEFLEKEIFSVLENKTSELKGLNKKEQLRRPRLI